MKILVAEDESQTRLLLCTSLRKWGYEGVPVNDGAAALEALKDESIRIAICDWEMPEMDGLTVCTQLRADPTRPYVYFILLTHHSESASLLLGISAGVDDFIPKPFNPTVLRARIESAKDVLAVRDSRRPRK